MSHIGNTFTYGAAGIATALSLIGLGKVGQFLKSNGSIVSAGLLTGVATAAAVPLTKRAVVFLPPEVYQNLYLQRVGTSNLPGERKDKINFVLSCIASLGLSLVVTALLTNRLTNFISGYRLSYPKLAGVSLLSGVISGVGFGAGSLFVKQQIRENRSEQSSILAQLEIPPLTIDEGITAAIAGLGTLALTSAILTTMILTSRLAVWTWASYPTIRGVFPTATLVAAGYMVGKTATNNSKIGYLAAFVLGTFVSPKANRLISSHEMSYWHGAGFSIVGIVAHFQINRKPSRRTPNVSFDHL